MGLQSQVNSDLFVNGNLSAASFTPPAASIQDRNITGSAGNYVNATKLSQQIHGVFKQSSIVVAATDRQVIHLVAGLTANVQDFRVGLRVAAAGAATVTVDLWKNGSSILTSPITLNSSSVVGTLYSPGGYTSTTSAVGDVFEVNVVATAGGGTLPMGVHALLRILEDPL